MPKIFAAIEEYPVSIKVVSSDEVEVRVGDKVRTLTISDELRITGLVGAVEVKVSEEVHTMVSAVIALEGTYVSRTK